MAANAVTASRCVSAHLCDSTVYVGDRLRGSVRVCYSLCESHMTCTSGEAWCYMLHPNCHDIVRGYNILYEWNQQGLEVMSVGHCERCSDVEI